MTLPHSTPLSVTEPPLIFVTHLPSASSFYASILQPLGLQFLSSPPPLLGAGAVLHYGYISTSSTGPKHVVLFSITQSLPGTVINPARITLSAGSEKAVRDFYAKSEILNIGSRTPAKLEILPSVHDPSAAEGDSDIKAVTRDFDNNMLEAVYRSRNGDSRGVMYRGQSGRVREIETASSEKEARRVLEWQEQVARSINEGSIISGGGSEVGYRRDPPPMARRSESYPVPAQPLRLVRRETVTTEHYRRPDERDREGGGGTSGKAILGTLLGAAAGAAFAYAMVRSESPPRMASRRATYGGPQGQSYAHTGTRDHVVERIPARSYVSARGEGTRPRYVEYVAATPRVAQIDEKSYHSGSQRTGRSGTASRTRARSEVGTRYERPLTILPAQSVRARSPGSNVSRSYKTAESRHRSPSRSRHTGSHVSSRSYHSVSTAKPPVSTTKIRVVPGERERRVMHSGLEREVDRARQVPLPMSVVSGYAGSVAPSDSVSSIGSKRERERLRSRMSYGSGASRGW